MRYNIMSFIGVQYGDSRFWGGGQGGFLGPPPVAYGSSQARAWTGATAAGQHHSHSNVGSELRLRPTLQLTAMPDP